MRKRWFYVLAACLMIYICGCGNKAQEQAVTQTEPETVQNEKNLLGDDGTEVAALENDVWQEYQHAATVLEDEETLYFCGKNYILKETKESGATEYIWENARDTDTGEAFQYSGTRGILAADKLYFIEEWTEEEAGAMWALSVVGTDGSGYELIESFESNPSEKEDRLVLLDGILYYVVYADSKEMEGYRLDQNGSILKEEKVNTKAENVPVGYWEVYYYENGSRPLSTLESRARFGYYLLRDEEYELCIVDPETGIKEEFPLEIAECNLLSMTDTYFLFENYSEEKMILMDSETKECRELADYNMDDSVIRMDDDYVYIQKVLNGDDFTQYQYQRVDLATGNSEKLFTVDSFAGMEVTSPWFLMDISVLNDCIYYAGAQDYKLYLMRRALDMPAAEEEIGDAFYDTQISQVGTIETYKETIYSTKEPEMVIGSLDMSRLVVDARFAGADSINQVFEEEQQSNMDYLRKNAAEYDTWEDYEMAAFSFSSNVSPIYYMDGHYLSFVQENYDYTGGAHGMPYWIGYTFDLETGKELVLSDIISEDDAAVKEIVTRYFAEQYNKEPDAYWEDAVDIVKESVSLQSPFYLNEEGMVFYFGPYELAPYAGGFIEVVIPYSEFNLKINLQQL